MNKRINTLLFFSAMGITGLQAQSVVTIKQVQERSSTDLANCQDSSSYYKKEVTIRGVVVTDGSLARQTSSGCTANNSRNIWIQDGKGAWSGLDVWGSCANATNLDIRNLVAGDSVEITGKIDEFQGETELVPNTTGTAVKLLGSGKKVHSNLINLSDLNDDSRVNKLGTGEQWEGVFVEFKDLTVVSVDPFSSGTRVSFVVQDASGNKMNVSDRFVAQKFASNGGNFISPNVGDKFSTLKGILMHSKNGTCLSGSGRGYELHPFAESHYVTSDAAPSISEPVRDKAIPKSTETVTISVNVTSTKGISAVKLYFAVGVANSNYTAVNMTANGSTYTASIPALAEGSFVKYYVTATDNATGPKTSANPNVPGGSNPLFYIVRDNGLSIRDIQYTPFTNGNSGFLNKEVTVTGVVTASAESDNLGYVFIQQEGELSWAGIMTVGNASLSALKLGDKVTVTGTVEEDFGMTRLGKITSVQKTGTGKITPIRLRPDVFTKYNLVDNEPFEGMLVTLVSDTGTVKVVKQNADAPSNFAEYRVGADVNDPNTGTRVLAGRQNSSSYSSLNVSYVNDSSWATKEGTMKVPVLVVKPGVTMDSLTGIIYYSFSNMKILPRNNKDFHNISLKAPEDTTGIAPISFESAGYTVFPNPSAGSVTIQATDAQKAFADRVSILELSGRVLVHQQMPLSGSVKLETALSAGCYLLQLSNSSTGRSALSKLFIQR